MKPEAGGYADVIIIGAGVAGLSAAVAAARTGLSALVVEHMAPGGQVATIEHIRNYPGFPEGVAGYDLGPMLQQQAEDSGAGFVLDTVTAIEPGEEGFRVLCSQQTLTGRTVILATGSRRRALGVPGETELEGRGVSHCADCDGPLFRGASTIVVGGGDSGFDEAEVLARYAGSVTIVHRGGLPLAQRAAVERVHAISTIDVRADTEVVGIVGSDGVTAVDVIGPNGKEQIPAEGVFAYPGLVPNSELAAALAEVDADGRIVADLAMCSSFHGLFVAGDVRSGAPYLLASAVGDGAVAAVSAARFVSARHPIARDGNRQVKAEG